MPAKSKAQQIAMAIAEHQPGKLFKRNSGLLKMSKSKLHEFATTRRTGLPNKISGQQKPKSHAHKRMLRIKHAITARISV